MEISTLDDLMALNDQLVALANAGVPIDIGAGDRDLERTLESVNAAVARAVSRSASLEEAIEQEAGIPARYRCLVLTGLRSRDMGAALDISHRTAASVEHAWDTASAAFFYPLIICALAYVGLVMFCIFFVPNLEQTYDTFRIEAGYGLGTLRMLRQTLPYWVAVPPILLLIFAWHARHRQVRAGSPNQWRIGWLPGFRGSVSDERWATFAETLAALERSGAPLEESLPLAACACSDTYVVQAADALAADLKTTDSVSVTSSAAKRFPPFLRWAILQPAAAIGRTQALETAARLYRDSAERRAARTRVVAPLVLIVALGGSVTLLYALSVFLPVVEMLRALASSGATPSLGY